MTGRRILTRRGFMGGAAALGALWIAGCGDDDGGTAACAVDRVPDDIDEDLSAVRFFGPYFAAGEAARVPFGLSDSSGLLALDETPSSVAVTVFDPGGAALDTCQVARRFGDGLPRPYFALDVTPPTPGFYDVVIDVDGRTILTQFEVVAPTSPAVTTLVGPGDRFPRVATPTVADGLGVDPICTNPTICPLHETSLDTVLGAGPVALLVATPAFCSTVVCGPVLDILLGLVGDYPDVTFVHAEVYAVPAENSVPPVPEDFAPIINAAGLAFEPTLYTIGADGSVVNRLDYIFAAEEMAQHLDALAAAPS